MIRLVSQDYEDILNLIYATEADQETTYLRTSVLPAMEKMFRAHSGAFFLTGHKTKGLDLNDIVTHNIKDSASSQYAQYYWHLDPMYPKGTFPTKSVLRNSDIILPSRWLKLEYYNDFHRPLNEHWELDIYLRSEAALLGWICLFRSRRQPDFDEKDILKANILAPCITGALRNAILFSKTEEERDLFRSVIEFSPEGIVILDSELRPVYCNSKAKEVLSGLFDRRQDKVYGADSREFPVPFEIMQNCLTLKRSSRSRNRIVGVNPRITIHSIGNKIFRIESFLFHYPFQAHHTPCFLVSIKEILETYNSGKGASCKECLLTQREVEIVRYVADGLTNKEIADRLLVSEFTVQKHLKNIFDKTGYRNRTQLASYVQSHWLVI